MGYKGVESEMGKVLMADQYYPTSANAHIQFDLDNFFGFKSLTMQVAEA